MPWEVVGDNSGRCGVRGACGWGCGCCECLRPIRPISGNALLVPDLFLTGRSGNAGNAPLVLLTFCRYDDSCVVPHSVPHPSTSQAHTQSDACKLPKPARISQTTPVRQGMLRYIGHALQLDTQQTRATQINRRSRQSCASSYSSRSDFAGNKELVCARPLVWAHASLSSLDQPTSFFGSSARRRVKETAAACRACRPASSFFFFASPRVSCIAFSRPPVAIYAVGRLHIVEGCFVRTCCVFSRATIDLKRRCGLQRAFYPSLYME